MTDSVGDGWNGNILSIMQNDTFVQSFGETFTYGMLTEPVYVLVQGNRFAQIYVNQLGSGTPEVGFVVKSPSGTTLCQKSVGTAFYSSTLFPRFCVAGGCPTPATLNLTILIYDSYGDGWNGNVLGIKQNNTIVGTFGSNFYWGTSMPPAYLVVQGNQ